MNEIKALEERVANLKAQMQMLLDRPDITQAQRDAVSMGHGMMIEEIEERLACLRSGKPDPFA